MTKDEQIMALRELLWKNHGHTGQYGDDGEMQCSQCMSEYLFWDWKRTPVEEIVEKIIWGNIRKALDDVFKPDASQPLNSVDVGQQVDDAYDTDWCDEPTDQDYI